MPGGAGPFPARLPAFGDRACAQSGLHPALHCLRCSMASARMLDHRMLASSSASVVGARVSPLPCRISQHHARVAKRVQAIAVPESPVEQKEEKLVRPDAEGRYGRFGGKYVPETLIPALAELEAEYAKALKDPSFQVRGRTAASCCGWTLQQFADLRSQAELDAILKDYVGRETPLYYAERLSEYHRRCDCW